MRPPSSAAVSRRRVLGATVAAAAVAATGGMLSGCTTEPDRAGAGPRRTPGADAGPTSGDEAAPDVLLAAAVRAEEEAALRLVQATTARHRSLRRALRAVEAGHVAHLALLADVVPDRTDTADTADPAPAKVPAVPAAALRRVTRTEDRLATSLKRHAFAAESGPFARLLGSMAAAAAQQAVVLGGTGDPVGAA